MPPEAPLPAAPTEGARGRIHALLAGAVATVMVALLLVIGISSVNAGPTREKEAPQQVAIGLGV